MKRIVLTLKSNYICDILSINEWNKLITSYENDPKAIINNLAMDEELYIYTTLENVLNNHSKADLRFLDKERTW